MKFFSPDFFIEFINRYKSTGEYLIKIVSKIPIIGHFILTPIIRIILCLGLIPVLISLSLIALFQSKYFWLVCAVFTPLVIGDPKQYFIASIIFMKLFLESD
jgi:hypothetical protein